MNMLGAIMFTTIGQVMANTFMTILFFINERPVFLREMSSKTYKAFPYFLSKTVVDLPLQIITPILTSSITYFAMGFSPSFE